MAKKTATKTKKPGEITTKDIGIAAGIGVGAGVGFYFLAKYLGEKEEAPTPGGACKVEGATVCIGADLYQCQESKWVLIEANSVNCGAGPAPPDEWSEIASVEIIVPLSGYPSGTWTPVADTEVIVPLSEYPSGIWTPVNDASVIVPLSEYPSGLWTPVADASVMVPLGAPIEGLEIVGVYGQSQASYGESVLLNVKVRNDFLAYVSAFIYASVVNVSTIEFRLYPGVNSCPLRFTMPNKSFTTTISVYYKTTGGDWYKADSVTYRIGLI